MGQALARALGAQKKNLVLLGRDKTALEAMAADVAIRYGVTAKVVPFEATDFASHASLFHDGLLEGVEGAILCQGYLNDNAATRVNFEEWKTTLDVNFTSVVSCLTPLANYFERKKRGFLCVVSSVAGVRGRQSNYVYGSAKAGVSTFLEGLRHRLFASGVTVTEVRPGFVDTSMTYGLPGLFLVAPPEKVAGDILKGIQKKQAVRYTPFFWWGILTIIRCLPRFVFHRSKL